MADTLRRHRVHLKSSAGDMFVTLLARSQPEAEILAMASQQRRASRFDLTFARLDARLADGEITEAQHAAELVRRQHDQSRYDRVTQVEAAKDEAGNPVMVDEVVKAEAPFKVAKIEEAKS